MFADPGTASLGTADGSFKLRGGHRLLHAPEAMPRTYMPDNQNDNVVPIPDGFRIDMPAEP